MLNQLLNEKLQLYMQEQYLYNVKFFAEVDILRDEFIKDYPIDKIENLTLQEFIIEAKGAHTFCKRLRYDLQGLGTMGDARPDIFGIYKKDNTVKLSRTFKNIYENDYEAAFFEIKKEVVRLLYSIENDDYRYYENCKLNRLFKNKLLMVYFPDKVIPVCVEKTLNDYCECVGFYSSEKSFILKDLALKRFKESHVEFENLSNSQFMGFCDWLRRQSKDSAQSIPNNKQGVFYSWEILSEDVAIKTGDKTVVQAGETGIPQEIYWFFDCANLTMGEKIPVKITYNKITYIGFIRRKNDGVGRINLTWRGELHDLLKSKYMQQDRFPLMRFEKTGQGEFTLSFIQSEVILQDDNSPSESEIEISSKEGKKKLVYTTKYERDPKIRRKALLIHGFKCEVCGFDFEEVYGEIGKEFIEVHHIKPLSSIGEETDIDPRTDLICLCSNCHRMIHRNRNQVLTPKELKEMLRR